MKRSRKKKKMSPQVRAMLAALKRSRRSKRKAARKNPPRRARTARRRRRSSSAGPTIHATRLGKVKSITYTHAVDGKLYKHAFGRGTNVAYTRDNKMILWPVRIQPFIGDHQ